MGLWLDILRSGAQVPLSRSPGVLAPSVVSRKFLSVRPAIVEGGPLLEAAKEDRFDELNANGLKGKAFADH